MRPDRIILGEIRGVEVLDMLQAMNTGNEGSMCTIHANSAGDALRRLAMLAGLAGFSGAEQTLKEMIASAIDMVVHIGRRPDGSRRITQIVELVGVQDSHYSLHELFSFDDQKGSFINASRQLQCVKFRQRADGAMPGPG